MAKENRRTDLPSTSRANKQQGKYNTRFRKDRIAKKPARKTKNTGAARNRASPARLVKLYSHMSDDQKEMIKEVGFGGLLEIKCDYMPADLIQWLLTECFDADKSELVLPGRGRVKVTANSAEDITGLPNPINGDDVKYDLDCDAINFVHNKYGIENGVAPRIKSFVEKLEVNKDVDDDYLRSWLILAICTFVCPTTCLGISPRCYPSVVDTSAVKKLKWCHFIVDQLRISKDKMSKRNSVKGCIFYLMVLYLDSLDHNLEISDCQPRIGAWDTKLMEQVVEMDRKDDGSFGRLKLKQTRHTVIDTSIGGCFADLERFVSSKIPRGLSSQDKMKLTEAFGQAFNGFSEIMGNLLQSVSEVVGSSGTSERSNKRRRLSSEGNEEGDEDVSDRDDEVEFVSSDMSTSEDDDESYQEAEDSYQDDEIEDDEQGQSDSVEVDDDEANAPPLRASDAGGAQGKQDGSGGQQPLHKESVEQHEAASYDQLKPQTQEHQSQADDAHKHVQTQQTEEPPGNNLPSTPVPIPVHAPTPSSAKRKVISSRRSLGRLRLPPKKDVVNLVTPECLPAQNGLPLPQENVVHNIHSSDSADVRGKSVNQASLKSRSAGDMAGQGTSKQGAATTSSWDFKPPASFDILGFAEQQVQEVQGQSNHRKRPDWLDDNFLDHVPWEVYQKLENDAYMQIRKANACRTPSTSHQGEVKQGTPALNDIRNPSQMKSASKSCQLQTPVELQQSAAIPSALSSGTPLYQAPPQRIIKPSLAMQSPFYQDRSNPFKCSKEVNDVYHAVCRFATVRTTRSSQSPKNKSQIIIHYLYFWVTLLELADSVRIGNQLLTPVAEVALCALDEFDPDHKTRKKIPKRVLPLRVASFIQTNQLDRPEVRRVFRRGENHLDRHDMVMFPVHQKWKVADLDEEVGHYFLLVLNLRDLQFEVLDSMRTLQDKRLRDCCAILMDGIKTLWRIHYPESKKDIQNYDIKEIEVPKQINPIDCGFHMLMNVDQWYGRHVPSYKGSDIPNIRKLLTYKWITHEKNDVVDWRSRLGMS